MPLSRIRPTGGSASCSLAVVVFLVTSTQIGHQDITSLMARHPSVAERWRERLIASPFGTIRAATFGFPRPVGTAIPEPVGFRLASLNPDDPDITGSLGGRPFFDPEEPSAPPLVFPTVNRALKGDRLVPPARVEPPPSSEPEQPQPAKVEPPPSPRRARQAGGEDTPSETILAGVQPQIVSSPVEPQQSAPENADASADARSEQAENNPVDADKEEASHEDSGPPVTVEPSAAVTAARLFFGVDAMGTGPAAIEPWLPGQQPVVLFPANIDPDIKLSALAPPATTRDDADGKTESAGETIAGKGEPMGEGHRPPSPAERLGLAGKARAKSEKCLADAVYFESRGEPERGQQAVAQVVMNRVFSGYYPDNVCGVVYQNAHRHLACQFTFACDGIKDRVTEPEMWEQAKRIARDTLDGKVWLTEVGKATHYHANYVHPWWVRTMRKHQKIGVHIFYRPRKWGDGADMPEWGSAAVVKSKDKARSAAAAAAEKKL